MTKITSRRKFFRTGSTIASGGATAGRFASEQVSRHTLGWIFVAQGVAILPLFFHLPHWLPVYWLCAIIIRVQVYRGVWPYPGSKIKLVLGLVGMAGLALSFGPRMGVEPMIGLLVLSFVLKLVEVRDRAGVLIILYIGFVAVGAQLLLQQTFYTSIYALFSSVILLAALQSVFRHRTISVLYQLRAAGILLLQSLPVMLILFLVMPRLGQLWAVPSMRGAGTTGFSDSMSPGDFSELIQSSEIVLRASFDGEVPPPQQRYWRGLVLENFDGRRWSRRGAPWMSLSMGGEDATRLHSRWQVESKSAQPINLNNTQNAELYRYTVLLEPHQYPWLFSIMLPLEAHSPSIDILSTEEFLLVSNKPIRTRTKYNVITLQEYKINAMKAALGELRRNILLPQGGNPLSRKLAESWLKEGQSQQQIVEKALQLYRDSFYYTLRAPELGENAVDDFLFVTQRGFCEHYSSSFVFLMRAAGIPARVVVGYLGGEFNREGNYLVVRQSDAHAWAEVWLPGEGWRRVDPTAAVSPARIDQSLLSALDREETNLVGGALLRLRGMAMIAQLRNKMEEWDYLWQMRVMGYDSDSQRSTLEKLLGGDAPWRIAVFFVGGIGTLLFIYYMMSLIRHRSIPVPPHQRILFDLLKRLEKHGVTRAPNETLATLAKRISESHPQLSLQLGAAAKTYNAIAYQQQVDRLDQFRKQTSLI
ncbi:transglutaminase superfamily protein [Alteromonadaceae bacterium 2753L.S.0a.02]|nr:transglutaminase superfamily protein [Alteromonadaceae bacterium 2753L.S.0a.02]